MLRELARTLLSAFASMEGVSAEKCSDSPILCAEKCGVSSVLCAEKCS